MELEGVVVDADYVLEDGRSIIRLTVRNESNIYPIYDMLFYPYFYLMPDNDDVSGVELEKVETSFNGERITVHSVEEKRMNARGVIKKIFKISTSQSKNVPKLGDAFKKFGKVYEHDIVFWKRYLIDKQISPMAGIHAEISEENGRLHIKEIAGTKASKIGLKSLCFDIETYNPAEVPRPEIDPILMISYAYGEEKGVLTTKKIDRDFVRYFESEKEMIEEFSRIIRDNEIDAIVGYNSSNFDMPYLIKRAEKLKADFNISRYGSMPKQEHHGLLETIKIPGRINVDAYHIAKFVSTVGASEKLQRANRFTLSEVYAAISGSQKKMVDRKNIWQIWDGSDADREELADYSLGDAVSLKTVYDFFMPLEIEISRVTGTTLGEACISTTGQLVEYFLMRYAFNNNEIVPEKPSEYEIGIRNANPIEGAYVKAPEAGIYKRIAVFDFRSLYPSIIIAYNIDPSTLYRGSGEYNEASNGVRFIKSPEGIVPKALRILLKERGQVKDAYKKNPNDVFLGARSQALKIIANSFYGYLGYARSRWYSRDCAGSVTALGRAYIAKTIEAAEAAGFKVLYADTDSCFLLLGDRPNQDALEFVKGYNKTLPDTMELELEDFYVSGVFVGKKGVEKGGAKKKYALLSESGRIKIKGFELVRRDWSNISRETQKRVLDTILKDGNKEKAVSIVKEVVKRLREGDVDIGDLVIRTQLRRKIDSYDGKSPELSAAMKAISAGVKTKEEMEGSTIGYVVTRSGSSVSDKAMLAELAEDYDPDYYINHQIIPSTLKILKELGISEEELKGLGKQKKL